MNTLYRMRSNYSQTKLLGLEDFIKIRFLFSRLHVVTNFILHAYTIYKLYNICIKY